ncbi:unnamed protein product [Clonostachys solani]|uniref:Uncharacterized protein n=1 Tax=Clonostachys solani TaxID=160281 RepID=A0A9N9Z437_9HYPO|nr:unnamed protein product [Clonostachys solani]
METVRIGIAEMTHSVTWLKFHDHKGAWCSEVEARANQDEAQISQHAMAGKTSFNIEITSSQNQVAVPSL